MSKRSLYLVGGSGVALAIAMALAWNRSTDSEPSYVNPDAAELAEWNQLPIEEQQRRYEMTGSAPQGAWVPSHWKYQPRDYGPVHVSVGDFGKEPETYQERRQREWLEKMELERIIRRRDEFAAARAAELDAAVAAAERARQEELAAAEAALRAEDAERAAAAAVLVEARGGDPSNLQHFAHPALTIRNPVTICNSSGSDIKFAMIWQNTASAFLTGENWLTEGYFDLGRGKCESLGLGTMNGRAAGFLSIFKRDGNEWLAGRYAGGGADDKPQFTGETRWICWPDYADVVDPDDSCPSLPERNMLFNVRFQRFADTDDFKLTVTDGGIESSSQTVRIVYQ